MSETIYRIHPAIGMARVGNSEEYYIGPETEGGLPIKPDTESDTITSNDLRDSDGKLKRQAARFKIFQYPKAGDKSYPLGDGEEIKIGSTIDGKEVTDIIWMVHLANKKANCYMLENPKQPHESIIDGYKDGNLPPLRNPTIGSSDPNDPERLKQLTIDPGPRTIQCYSDSVRFDQDTEASFLNDNERHDLPNYPKLFPDCCEGEDSITSLGELQTDDEGRLLVLGAYGKACPFEYDKKTLEQDVDNDGWFDDTADGPVSAVLVFDDGTSHKVEGSAWVVSTDPSYAPQILNIVSLWDDIYDTWIRKLGLSKDIYDGNFKCSYAPNFNDHLKPIFRSTGLQQWTTNLPDMAINAHQAVDAIEETDKPAETILSGLAYIRNPNNDKESEVGPALMPLALGDSGKPFLSLTKTQYFFLTQWNEEKFTQGFNPKELGPGEELDKAVLANCLGGRFSPGIDMTFIVRDPNIYENDWSDMGPFRIRIKDLEYTEATEEDEPFLTEGYVPYHTNDGLEPGDTSKFMAIPWHTDYNSCATHTTDPNPLNQTTLYWSWPAQRPVTVYRAEDVNSEQFQPVYSVRGYGTDSDDPANAGRYKDRNQFIENWHKIGIVIQGSAIDEEDGGPYDENDYLEVKSKLDDEEASAVPPWPLNKKNEENATSN